MKVYTTLLDNKNNWRSWMDMFYRLSKNLETNYNAEIISQVGSHLRIDFIDHNLPDCEVVIYDDEKDILYAMSLSETQTRLWDVFCERNKKEDVFILVGQEEWGMANKDLSVLNFQLKQCTYYTFLANHDYDHFYNIGLKTPFSERKDKLFFKCATGRVDAFTLEKQGYITCDVDAIVDIVKYCESAITHKVGLTIAGNLEMCYRDIENMALGVPNLRFEYCNKYDPQLIPNVHYIAVERGELAFDTYQDLRGSDINVQKYINRFNEVKDDYDFLQYVALNARQYYEQYCSKDNNVNLLLTKFNL